MLLASDFDAELHIWLVVMHPTEVMTYPVIVGTVWHDKKGRFADGRTIRTSALLSPATHIQPGAVIQTLNTRYLLVAPQRGKTSRPTLAGGWRAPEGRDEIQWLKPEGENH